MPNKDDQGGVAPALEDEIGALQHLLEDGRPGEAAPRLRTLAEAHPRNSGVLATLARCCRDLGEGESELAALEQLLTLEPLHSGALARVAALLAERGDIAGAAAHCQALSDAKPGLARPAMQLAVFRQRLGDHAGEAAALKRFLEVKPDHSGAHGRLADLLEAEGKLAEAAPHLKRFLQARPEKTRAWVRLAQAAEAAGDRAEAEAAWARVAELHPGQMAASERLTALRLIAEGSARGPASGALKVQVLGNCQAYAMGRCLRALLPNAEVTALNWGELSSDAHIAHFVQGLGIYDVLVTQPVRAPELERLGAELLLAGPARSVFFPGLHFTGFQPDALRTLGKGLTSMIGEWHSALIMAAWRMGLPARRAEELFNAYVYGALGYFDEYAKASRFLLQGASKFDWDLSAELQAWPAPFVHTPNHPRIGVMMDLARGVCARLGLDTDPDAAAPADPFVASGTWPIYPEIGKRLGLKGETTFVSIGKVRRAFALDEAIAWYYAAYAKASPESLAVRRVDEVIGVLRAEGI